MRKTVGLSFDGMTWPERFVATNLHHDFEGGGYWQSTMVIDDMGAVIVKITREGLWRCTYMEDAALPEATFMERIAAAYRHLLPGEGGYTLDRASPYQMHQRCAETFPGRVLLATPRTSPDRPRDSASRPGCSTPSRCGRRWRR